jgi:hypothetical protein
VKVGGRRDKTVERSVPKLAIPVFGYKSHITIDRRIGFIRTFAVTDAACHEGRVLRPIVTTDNTAYRPQASEHCLASKGRVSRIHHRKPKGRLMAQPTHRANARKSAVRATVAHVSAHQKDRMGLLVRTIGKARAEAKFGLANFAYNIQPPIFHQGHSATA